MKRREQDLGPVLGAKPTLRERMARSFSLKRGLALGLLAIPGTSLLAVLNTGDLSAFLTLDAWLLSLFIAPIVFIVGCFTENVGI